MGLHFSTTVREERYRINWNHFLVSSSTPFNSSDETINRSYEKSNWSFERGKILAVTFEFVIGKVVLGMLGYIIDKYNIPRISTELKLRWFVDYFRLQEIFKIRNTYSMGGLSHRIQHNVRLNPVALNKFISQIFGHHRIACLSEYNLG